MFGLRSQKKWRPVFTNPELTQLISQAAEMAPKMPRGYPELIHSLKCECYLDAGATVVKILAGAGVKLYFREELMISSLMRHNPKTLDQFDPLHIQRSN